MTRLRTHSSSGASRAASGVQASVRSGSAPPIDLARGRSSGQVAFVTDGNRIPREGALAAIAGEGRSGGRAGRRGARGHGIDLGDDIHAPAPSMPSFDPDGGD